MSGNGIAGPAHRRALSAAATVGLRWRDAALIATPVLGAGVCGALWPVLLGTAIDGVFRPRGYTGPGPLLVLIAMAAVGALGAAFAWVRDLLSVRVGQRIASNLRRALSDALARTQVRRVEADSPGRILALSGQDVDAVAAAVQEGIPGVLGAVLCTTATVVALTWTSPILAFVVGAALATAAISPWLVAMRGRGAFVARAETLATLTVGVEETCATLEAVAASDRRVHAERELLATVELLY
ncbi:MAG: transporter ATP-binding protein/permease, partial [Actinomycetota bacterium]|nr:transporter ATP-binding protein/permease [Actinomycetota bacterium]